ncbi:hypothetical protein SAMD00019534_085880 [Acytostelium subglobosum LB1]|uniref:hypothetical protein n=1 Tax=Acytostelium subglobosum LB1 TaxID=1410327 RepID=UPI000644C88D|nr:hypothetical protein SAMD00019534_085880 [Acytostelium subglobosum LB1]GAM25413.1 hypothetical protein SAMD00019534_085880 [Acytostelium subglobosum LB1]|eukprot:XP_012751399.1 hypothetical protein SAMD00019534_085880 [Acytostelium subglobosum LB1]
MTDTKGTQQPHKGGKGGKGGNKHTNNKEGAAVTAKGGAGGDKAKKATWQKTKEMKKQTKKDIRQQFMDKLKAIEERIENEKPPKGTNPLANDNSKATTTDKKTKENVEHKINYTAARMFSELPISDETIGALEEAKYKRMTEIQRASIPHALCGRDILGAAKTGSGKTLAFIVPMLEVLWRANWTENDGVGAIILSPTRELAIQIFEVLRVAGKRHGFSAGLIIGGKDVEGERKRINMMNILIATPGRLLQHMDQTDGFQCHGVKMLILDEADRILDLGFTKTLNAIISNLPKSRQTLLFSATQTKSIKDLARLSLNEPEYISVYDKDQISTPNKLVQTVCVAPLDKKLDLLFSFIKTHLTQKTIVFLSTCKQVRFVYEMFRLMNPGCRLYQLHGKMKQWTRLEVFQDFSNQREGTMFATDIAARGLDFPEVDWVVQLDCPDDIQTYIHRVGRTARYHANGKSFIVLLPSERDGFTALMDKQGMKYDIMDANPNQLVTIHSQLASFLSEKSEHKYLAQKAFVSYLKSMHRQENKGVFNIEDLDLTAYSKSMGLPGAPKVQFGKTLKVDKNQPYAMTELKKKEYEKKLKLERGEAVAEDEEDEEDKKMKKKLADDDDSDEEVTNAQKPLTKLEKLFKRKNTDVFSETYDRFRDKDAKEKAQDDDMFVLKRKDHELKEDDYTTTQISRKKEKRIKKKLALNDPSEMVLQESKIVPKRGDDLPTDYLAQSRLKMAEADVEDKEVHREKLKLRRLAKEAAERERELQKKGGAGDKNVAYFVPPSDEEENGDDDDGEEQDDQDYDNDDDNDEYNDQEDEDYEEEEEEFVATTANNKKRKNVQQQSIEEQESLALKLLAKKKRSN